MVSHLLIVLDEAMLDNQDGAHEPRLPADERMIESATATLCNLALHQEFKDAINRHGVPCLTKVVIIPYSGVGRTHDITVNSDKTVLEYQQPAFIFATGTIR